ncbi:PIN domain nuclease, a component of toxin-antitoxin system (PIN domain) [Flexibacter flexilis DSM 6793]|uniref:PIN domain nuclease, a component of toxin-antitoxin system (PIN domain) n=1 Tax=Flexibacter flexilis DSM 6793 TaxID=927664 RepID=A0A1I1M5D4_9BACT|nr:type II toxin-antitoxin system VapC family toxin [Flexibacter flexilis]SFC80246.1 PIN domain nuclease, a component of toxin-antitoxin system (PIN domain) [Flexibacter flexilis DSM 6793]
MKYLIDTNIFIYIFEKKYDKLSSKQRSILNNAKNEFYLSEASYFEIAIKRRMGKPDFSHISVALLESDRKVLGIKLLKPKTEHYLNVVNVEKVLTSNGKPHADPFDLLIISQAIVEQFPVLSTDNYFPDYKQIKAIS